MDPSTQVVGLDPQGNMVFTMVKTMGIFQMSPEQSGSAAQGGMSLQVLPEHSLVPSHAQGQAPLQQSQAETHDAQPPPQVSAPVQTQQVCQNKEAPPSSTSSRMPYAEVSSLLDPNMKGSKARKYLISYDEIKRRLQSPEKMSLRSLAAYTRVSRGPASKKTLLESLKVLGLTPSTTTAVSSSFSKLTEGDTRALCDDMKDFAHDYIDYGNMAKQLIPETNTVQHWSKIIESKNHLEDMRKSFRDPANTGAFDSVTHGLGLGMLDVALDMVVTVIEQQIRILSGAAAAEPTDSSPPTRRIRRRHRKTRPADGEATQKVGEGVAEQGKVIAKRKARVRAKKKARQEAGTSGSTEMRSEQKSDAAENNVLTLVSVGYEAVSSGLSAEGGV